MLGKKERKRQSIVKTADLIIARPHSAYSLGGGQVAVYLKAVSGGTEPRVISDLLYAVLKELSAFRSLARHIDSISQSSPLRSVITPNVLADGIKELGRKGLILKDQDFLTLLKEKSVLSGNNNRKKPALISTIAWPTQSRPQLVRRSILSADSALSGPEGSLCFIVFDHSMENESDTFAMCRDLQKKLQHSLYYFGNKEREKFFNLLLSHQALLGIDPELLSFAILPTAVPAKSPGSNRNCITLTTKGEALISSDDDTLFSFTSPDSQDLQEIIKIKRGEKLLNARVYSDYNALSEVPFTDKTCIVSEHERFLGRSLGEIQSELHAGSGFKLTGLDIGSIAYLLYGKAKTVTCTMPGIAGDSGIPYPYLHLQLPEASLVEIFSDEESARSLGRSRIVNRFTPSPVISRDGHFMATHYALDNRSLIPPFLPVDVGEDAVFSSVLRYQKNGSLFAYLPYSILHKPEGRSTEYSKGFTDIECRLADIIIRLIDYYRLCMDASAADIGCGDREEEDRLRSLGRYLCAVSGYNDASLEELLHNVNLNYYQSYLHDLERFAEAISSAPKVWEKSVKIHAEAIRSALQKPESLYPLELGKSYKDVLNSIRYLLSVFGKLLIWWPEIRRSANEIIQSGERIFLKP